MSSEPEPQLEPRTSTENWYRQLLGTLGLLIYILGLVFGLYFSFLVYGNKIVGVFTLPTIDFVPLNRLGSNLDCPALLTTHETGTLTVRVENPFPEPSGYTVHVAAYQFAQSERTEGPVVVSGPEDARVARFFGDHTLATSGTIPARGAATITWKIGVTDRQGDAILVNVYADTDRTFYMDNCGMVLINLPGLTGRQIAWLIVLSMPLGGLLWLYGRTPLRCRGYLTLVIGALLWLLIMWILNGFSLTSAP